MVKIRHVENIFHVFVICIMSVTVLNAQTNKHFVFISASYNNAEWYERSLQSVFSQKYTNWSMIYINDSSADGTGELVEDYVAQHNMQNKVRIIHNEQRMGHCYNQYHAIHSCPDNVVIIILDGDDWLANDDVLNLMNTVYQEDVWITYGQFRYFKRRALGCSRPIPHQVLENNTLRYHPSWITSHMRTFYAGLYKKIHIEDLMYDGAFVPMSVDFAIMIPMIEMAGWHSRFIKDVIYIYNDSNTLSFFNDKAEKQRQVLERIRSYPRYERLEGLPFQTGKAIKTCKRFF